MATDLNKQVMERANAWLNGATEPLELEAVRGTQGIKEATVNLAGPEIKVCVASGASNAAEVMEKLKNGNPAGWTFIEIMGCPGGCVNGGGQPIVPSNFKNFHDVRAIRAAGLYGEDANMPLRKSHENKEVQKLYKDYLGEPCSHKAHELLHTHYTERGLYK